ncbi:hypothetical protein FQN54_002497 [Arachnomyces sp. PD_36]|nr:hypothetical protein FQN54_002497 [Arachnomyces sp. PD_36]
MSSIGSITSVFEPEPYCLKELYLDDDGGDLYLNPLRDPKCYPPGFPENADNQIISYYYYSPAICPSGYTSACGETCLAKPLPMRETAIKCCAEGYTCIPGSNFCSSAVPSATEVTLTNQQKVTTVPASPKRVAYGLGLVVRHQSSDLELFASATEGGATAIHTASETGSGDNSSDTDSESSESSGLPMGAKIAIGVIVPVVLIALFLIIFCFCRRKKANGKEDVPQPSGPWVKPELDSTEVELTEQRIYDSKGPVKMPPHTYELPNSTVYHEMDSRQHAWPQRS